MGRSPCCSKEGLNRGAWTALEDKILTAYIKAHGEGKWRNLPKRAGNEMKPIYRHVSFFLFLILFWFASPSFPERKTLSGSVFIVRNLSRGYWVCLILFFSFSSGFYKPMREKRFLFSRNP